MRHLRRLAVSLVAAIATLALLNGTAALGERWAYGTVWRDGGPVGLYQNGNDGRRHLVPGAHLDGAWYQIHINSLGFRGPELAEPRPAGGLRVWCLGGSTTFDIYAPDDASTWPARLGVKLAEALDGRQVDVINAGIPGELMSGNGADLQALGPRLRPDLVVLHVGPNDLRHTVRRTDQAPPPAASPIEYYAMFRVLQRVAAARGASGGKLLHRELSPGERVLLSSGLRDLANQVESLGARPIFVTHALRPAPGMTGDAARRAVGEAGPLLGLDPESTIAAFEAWNTIVREVAGEASMIDLRAAIPGDPELWGDATHFAAPGSERAADVLASGILAQLNPR